MKFIENVFNRLAKHWQSTLIGVLILVLTFMLFKKDIDVTNWCVAIGTVVALYKMFVEKDPDKTANKQ